MISPIAASAQTVITYNDYSLSAALSQSNFPGYTMPATMTVSLVNFYTAPLQANRVKIKVTMPNNMHFNLSSYTPPAGWTASYQPNGASFYENIAVLIPTVDVPVGGIPAATNFNIPVIAAGPVNNGTYIFELLANTPPLTYTIQQPPTLPYGNVTVADNPLPVKFETVSATAEGCKVTVKWSTSVEKNSQYFEIERSQNGTDFKAIGRTDGAGNSFELKQYQYVDQSPEANHNFYRVRQVDFDGKSEVSPVVNVKVDCKVSGINIYPNPAKEVINVSGLSNKSTIEIYNALGQKVASKSAHNTVEAVSLAGLADGTYSIQVVSGGEVIYTNKVVKK